MYERGWRMGLILATLVATSLFAAKTPAGEKLRVYVGTYTQGSKSEGIYRMELDLATGQATRPVLAAKTINPSFLAIHPNQRYLYAVNEVSTFDKKPGGAISAFAIDPKTGDLTFINQQSSGGAGPCHLIVDARGKNVLAANYGGGSICVLPIQQGGRLGKASAFIQHKGSSVTPRQKGPHAHSINLDASNRFALVADLGLDKVLIYAFDAQKGTLKENTPASVSLAPGAGPRHLAFHPSGKFAYVINEIHSTVTAMRYDPKQGSLEKVQTLSTLPEGVKKGNSTAEVQVHPSGKFLYGSNRGHNSIAIFAIDPVTGKLTPLGHQGEGIKIPRNFEIDPTGTYLLVANQADDSVSAFRIDPKTGKLAATGTVVDVPRPVCVKFTRG
jgi:6-phosphogluconolactonase